MRKIIFKQSNGWNVPLDIVFKDIPEFETIMEEYDFSHKIGIDEFIETVKRYLVFSADIVAPMAIITNNILGVSIKHNGSKYFLIIKEVEGGE